MARILHIEDNASNRKVVRYLLRASEHELLEATDGQAGLDLAAAEVPDLILLDIQLPVVSGYEVARRLKADARLAAIPVIAVTSYALSGDDTRALEAGCDAYVAKPFQPAQLLACVDRFLSNAS